MSNTVEGLTRLDANYAATVPLSVRERAGLDAGDLLRWRVDEDGELSVEVAEQRRGAFAELEPIELDEDTDTASDTIP